MKFNRFVNVLISGHLIWLILVSVPTALAKHTVKSFSQPTQTTYSVTINTTQSTVGSVVTVNWTAPDNHSASDYLRLAPINNPDNNYNWSQSLGSAPTGSFTVTLPSAVARYEFRLYRASDNTRAAQSQSFVVNQPNFNVSTIQTTIPAGGQLTISWNVPAGNAVTDRLVIARTNQPLSEYISQQTSSGINSGTAKAVAPTETGQYEIRYFKVGDPYPSAISSGFTVSTAAGGFAGQITQAENGNPIGGVLVEARQSGTTKAAFTTDSSGSYNLPVTRTGIYDLRVTAAGFPAVTRSSLTVTSGNTTVANFTLAQTALLSGKVTKNISSSSIPGANIQLKQGATVVATASTNGTGNYLLPKYHPVATQL